MYKLSLSLFLLSSLYLQADGLLCTEAEKKVVFDKAQKSTYENCKRNGMTWWYTDKGAIKSQVNFIDDKENGLYTSFYDNGAKKIVVNYKNAQKHGLQKTYYDNGVLGSTVMYENGRREGVMTDYDEEGYKYSEVFYKNNYKVGLKKYYNHQGEVTHTEEYKMDRNPVVVKMLEKKRKEVMIDLSKYGLMPKDAPKEERVR
ncbi:MAG: hypothetical protein JXQ67_09130 [Campylobacterales bacterium]|nr:hypothetical protein [Campylobacterales bacterium]